MIKALQVSTQRGALYSSYYTLNQLLLILLSWLPFVFPHFSSLSLSGESWVQDADDSGRPVCQHSREATQNDRPA